MHLYLWDSKHTYIANSHLRTCVDGSVHTFAFLLLVARSIKYSIYMNPYIHIYIYMQGLAIHIHKVPFIENNENTRNFTVYTLVWVCWVSLWVSYGCMYAMEGCKACSFYGTFIHINKWSLYVFSISHSGCMHVRSTIFGKTSSDIHVRKKYPIVWNEKALFFLFL